MKRRKNFSNIEINIKFRSKTSNKVLVANVAAKSVNDAIEKFKRDYPEMILVGYQI